MDSEASTSFIKVEDLNADDDVIFIKEDWTPQRRLLNKTPRGIETSRAKEQGNTSTSKQNMKRKVSDEYKMDVDISSSNGNIESPILKSHYYDAMIDNMKSVLANPEFSRDEKIQLLTIIPKTNMLSQHEATKIFSVSESLIQDAINQTDFCGIFTKPLPVEEKLIDQDTKAKVLAFFKNDNYSCEIPGKNISVIVNGSQIETKQKYLILCNPNEMYHDFKDKHSQSRIEFTQFVQLRPKWCVSLEDCWTQRSNLCTQHENALLLLQATGIQDSYSELISKCVCSTESKVCSLLRCEDCPGKMELRQYLTSKFQNDPYTVGYQQWVMTDNGLPEIITYHSTLPEYINTVVENFYCSIPHSFIAESQVQYFKEQTINLPTSKALILMCFNENYKFVLQDEKNCFYWNRQSSTLHSAVIYYKQKGVLKKIAMCSFSDDLNHDIGMVHAIQRYCVRFIKDMNPSVREVEYFTDGTVSLYKSVQNFVNLCKHKDDFRVLGRWSFFPDHCGMNECGKIASTVRRIATKANLKKDATVCLTSPKELFDFCVCEIPGIIFEYIDKVDIDKTRVTLQKRFKNVPPAGGTHGFHQFVPLSSTSIASNRLSMTSNCKYSLIHNFSTRHETYDYIVENLYVAAVYLNSWYVGVVLEVDHVSGDACLDLMHPPGLSNTFHWPSTKDQVWVPFAHVLCDVSRPVPGAEAGEYLLRSSDIRRICEVYSK